MSTHANILLRRFCKLVNMLPISMLIISISSLTAFGHPVLPGQKVFPFELKDIRLSSGMFRHAMEKDAEWLLSLEPDRFLFGFREQAGLEQKAPQYGGWETSGASGHTFGHYLSACAMMYSNTGDTRFTDRLDYIMHELALCQEAIGTGFIAGFPRAVELFEEIERGYIYSQGFDLNGGWVPMYTIHKLFAGLIDVYRLTGNPKSYEVLTNLAGWFRNVFDNLSDEQIQSILIAEHGGINESMADLYAITGDTGYLTLAGRLNHKAVFDPLAEGRDELAGRHANTQVPKVVGAIRQYELGGAPYNFKLAEFFWSTVVNNHSYVIGGNSEAEHFGMPGKLSDRLTHSTCETCNTYNMLKLTRHLFQLEPDSEKADYYERALYNQILASQNPDDGMVCYMSPLASGGRKTFSTPFDSFWCCVGTGFENHAKYGEFIYYHDAADNLYVNLFIPSVLTWDKYGMTFTQKTGFPAEDNMEYELKMPRNRKFTVNLRYPGWAEKGFELLVNGKKVKTTVDDDYGYVSIYRKWKNGDRITYVLTQTIRSEGIHGDNTVRAYLYGPIVLSSLLGDDERIPTMVTEDMVDAPSLISRVPGKYEFISKATMPVEKSFIPYYKTGGDRMMVYYAHYTQQEWERKEEAIRQAEDEDAWLRQNTVSHFVLGEMQPEREHNFRGENIKAGELHGRKFREAVDGGWFSFEMDVLPDEPVMMRLTYWGGLLYNYEFDIFVDDEPVGFDNIHNWGDRFLEKDYKIPAELTRDKNKVTITFKAKNPGVIAGPLFECRIIK